ncbi:nucleotidyltransferase domain-containing protein [Clostridium cochlearium]|uniref:Nucleotidyltransferase n=1 Tax=Clostridium cochlearium TaxID=1494 RepID=A0A1G9JI94_CLOCO|nr:nucleotidyltransferase domain-containing protein [Clostridium cochlearium]MBV1821876.1 nucleotidyltransferase domain-containing protein [Bacteroidales bacterium MSK.15.36]NSJ92576.1 nucleotidyltransferase domain-containing protein [Coprococcus sp. MSK.21.13]MBE6064214.1 nucleotidyltransferase domain-containing protein [Clostridium cochlearium]MBU5269403.1 nucleotidyltransferase domain-containing protein [Clostridium cochlearium]MCG4571040.1 nucleotidyltransferase domain-containing protein [
MSFNLDKDIIKDIIEVGSKYEVNKITLFGSRARGDNKKTSDIDLAVYCNEGFQDESKVYFELEDINTLLKFDIVFIKDNTDKKLIENIEREGVIIYERK